MLMIENTAHAQPDEGDHTKGLPISYRRAESGYFPVLFVEVGCHCIVDAGRSPPLTSYSSASCSVWPYLPRIMNRTRALQRAKPLRLVT